MRRFLKKCIVLRLLMEDDPTGLQPTWKQNAKRIVGGKKMKLQVT